MYRLPETAEEFADQIMGRNQYGRHQLRLPRAGHLREDAHDLVDGSGKLKISDFEVRVIELVRSGFGIDDQVERFRALLEAKEASDSVDMTPEQPGGESIPESFRSIDESIRSMERLTRETLAKRRQGGGSLYKFPDTVEEFAARLMRR